MNYDEKLKRLIKKLSQGIHLGEYTPSCDHVSIFKQPNSTKAKIEVSFYLEEDQAFNLLNFLEEAPTNQAYEG